MMTLELGARHDRNAVLPCGLGSAGRTAGIGGNKRRDVRRSNDDLKPDGDAIARHRVASTRRQAGTLKRSEDLKQAPCPRRVLACIGTQRMVITEVDGTNGNGRVPTVPPAM